MGVVGEWGGLVVPMVPISPLLCRTECDILCDYGLCSRASATSA